MRRTRSPGGICTESFFCWPMCYKLSVAFVSLLGMPIPSLYANSSTSPRLAPSFMAAACYATFGRLLWWVTPPESHNIRTLWCPSRFVTPLFVAFDIGSFLIQLLGAGAVGTAYASKSLSGTERHNKIQSGIAALKLGFTLQLICFGLFIVIGARFLYVSRCWTGKPLRYTAPAQHKWARLNWAINAATLAITVGEPISWMNE